MALWPYGLMENAGSLVLESSVVQVLLNLSLCWKNY